MSIEISSKQAKQFLTFQISITFTFLQFILLAFVVLSSITKKGEIVAKMASHAIFQYNFLAIDDTHNTWTNMIVKMIILRFLGSIDDKERRQAQQDPKGRPYGGSAPESSSVSSTGRTDARTSEHPMVVGRTDAMVLWCRRESKPSQPIGTG